MYKEISLGSSEKCLEEWFRNIFWKSVQNALRIALKIAYDNTCFTAALNKK